MAKRDERAIRRGRERARVLGAVAVVILGTITVRLYSLQVVHHDEYVQFARDNRLSRERVPAPRGFIRDRAGRVLVDDVLHFEVTMPWRSRDDVASTAAELARWLPIDTARVMARFDAWRERRRSEPFPLIPDAGKFTISFVRENADRFPSLRVISRARRRYRYGPLAAHVLGYVGEASDADLARTDVRPYHPGDMVGKTGLELFYENQLRGVDGQRALEVNASGRVLGELPEYGEPPQPGATLYLTLDVELQKALEKALARPGLPAAAVVLSVEDGAVIAAASLPAFDPNVFSAGISQAALDALLHDPAKPLFNRVSQARYPPASTFKVVGSEVILDERIVNPNEILVYCTGAHRFGNRVYRCWKPQGHGAMDLLGAFVQSCDVYYYKAAEVLDADALAEAARAFGYGARTGIDLPGETAGLVPDRAWYDERFGRGRWTQGQMLNNIIGQGEYLATILQVARMTAAVANGGWLVTPHLLDHVDGEPPEAWPKRRVRVLSRRSLRFLRRAMRQVVDDPDGTAHWTRIEGLAVAGKTGTAQNPHGGHHALYTAYAPADDPEIALAIIVENGGHGGEVAAPIARDFLMAWAGLEPAAARSEGQP